MIKLETRHFGTIEVSKEKLIFFKEGLPGFEHLKQFILIATEEGIFNYLQAIEDGDICLVIAEPYAFKADYAPIIKENYFEKLGGGDKEAFAVYVVACLRQPIEESTLNLAGPLLIHVENRQGIQVITEDKMYQTKHKLTDLMRERRKTC